MTIRKESAISRWLGLSTDTKPTGATVPVGSTFFEFDTNDTYITYDSTNWVVKDSKSAKRFKTLVTASANAAYVSGDVISNSSGAAKTTWDFLAVAGYNGGGGKIVQAQVDTTQNTCSATPTLYLFTTSSPGCQLADNNANTAPTSADIVAGTYIGKIDFPVLTTIGGGGNSMLYPTASCLPFYFTTPSTGDDLFGVMVTNTGATFASKDISVTLVIKRD